MGEKLGKAHQSHKVALRISLSWTFLQTFSNDFEEGNT